MTLFPGQFCGESMPKEASKEEINIKRTLYKVYSVSALDKAKDILRLQRTSISPEGQDFAGCPSLMSQRSIWTSPSLPDKSVTLPIYSETW